MLDVRSLINAWESIRSSVAPELSKGTPLTRRPIVDIADMSRRRETWEVFVSLMGYHEVEDTNPLTLLQELEKYTLQHEDSQVVTSFLAYVSQFRTISQEEFLSEAVRLNRLFSAEQIVRLGSTLDRLQECRAKHDNWEDVWRCVREAGGGQSATAAAR